MRPVDRQVTASTRIDLSMESDAQQVDEVVVVAYGVRKKGTIAGSVSTVKAEKMENVPAASFDQALQGQAPGLMVMSGSGEPSVAASFQIRGINSLSSGTSPLFILDGVPVSSADFNTLNPSNIRIERCLLNFHLRSTCGKRCSGDYNETRSGPGQGESDVPHPAGYFPTGSGQVESDEYGRTYSF